MTTLLGWMSRDAQISQDKYQTFKNKFSSVSPPHSDLGDTKGEILYKSTHRCFDSCSYNSIQVAVIGTISWSNAELAKISSDSYAKSLYHAYLSHGLGLFDYISGHFSFAIVNNNTNSVLLSIDRMGTNALSYTVNPHGDFVFATELGPIYTYLDNSTEINLQSIYDYLYFHVVPSPNTIFKNINKIEPAQYILFDNGKLTKKYYWSPVFTNTNRQLDDALKNELLLKLENSVKRCEPTKSTGAFLSGGLDSSTISGVLAHLNTNIHETHTFSIGFDEKGYDEIEYAHIAAEKYKTIQHDYYVTPSDVCDAITSIAQTYDEPYGNSSAIPALFCAKLAKESGIDTLLAGDGGDEIFAGNSRYAKQKIFDLYQKIPAFAKNSFLEPILLNSPIGNLPIARKARSYIQQAKLPMPKRMESYNFLNRIDLEGLFEQDFLQQVDSNNPDSELTKVYDRCRSDNIVDKMLYLDWKITLADNDLRKVNAMCELAGIDVKYPMLDDGLVEFSTTIPANLKLRRQQLRYYYKQALNEFLPEAIINKPKHGFGLPFGAWLKKSDKLQDIVYSSLDDFCKRSIIKSEKINEIISLHRSGHAAYYGTIVWVIVLLELWLKEHDLNI